jgi:hypothetical protein
MSRAKNKLVALAVRLSLEFLPLGLLANGSLSWASQHFPRLLRAASHAPASAVKHYAPAKTDSGLVLKDYDEQTRRSGNFLTAKRAAQFSPRSFSLVPFRFKRLLAPRVSPPYFQIRF